MPHATFHPNSEECLNERRVQNASVPRNSSNSKLELRGEEAWYGSHKHELGFRHQPALDFQISIRGLHDTLTITEHAVSRLSTIHTSNTYISVVTLPDAKEIPFVSPQRNQSTIR